MIEPKDIYTFYAVEYYLNCMKAEKDERAIKHYLNGLKEKYIQCLREVVVRQVNYYIDGLRVNAPITRPKEDESFQSLLLKIKRTLRGDKESINVKWVDVVEHLIKLEKVKNGDIKGLIFAIDRVNNTVHNGNTTILEKINIRLLKVYNTVHRCGIKDYMDYVDKDILNNLFIINKKEEYMRTRWGV